MYTIKQASARSGVSIPLLRAWERRYGVVHPKRTASGYRLYGDDDLERLRAVRHLVDQGWSASAAAASIGSMSATALAELAGPAWSPVVETTAAGTLIDAFVEAAGARDSLAIDSVLDQMFAQGSFEYVAGSYLMPALVELGTAWEAGRLDVGAEHAASHAALRRLAAAFEAAGSARRRGPVVIVGLPPGSMHELGALAFAIAARRAGLTVLYEGANLPAADWVEVALATRARAAVVGVVSPADQTAAAEVATALHDALPDILVAFGGRAATFPHDARVVRLTDDLAAAVNDLKVALR